MILSKGKLLLAVLLGVVVLCGAVQAEKVSYLYGSFEQKNFSSSGPLFAGDRVLASYEWNKILVKKYINILVKSPAEDVPKYKALGFLDVDSPLTLKFGWARVSDINGWGTEVNGEIHRRADFTLDVKAYEIAEVFKVIESYSKNNMETFRKNLPEKFASLMTEKSVAAFERGFMIDFNMTLSIKRPLDKKATILMQNSQRFGYYRCKK